jgi:hypothetical protein
MWTARRAAILPAIVNCTARRTARGSSVGSITADAGANVRAFK